MSRSSVVRCSSRSEDGDENGNCNAAADGRQQVGHQLLEHFVSVALFVRRNGVPRTPGTVHRVADAHLNGITTLKRTRQNADRGGSAGRIAIGQF